MKERKTRDFTFILYFMCQCIFGFFLLLTPVLSCSLAHSLACLFFTQIDSVLLRLKTTYLFTHGTVVKTVALIDKRSHFVRFQTTHHQQHEDRLE